MTWGGTAYCPSYIGELVRNSYPVGTAVVLQQVTVIGVDGQMVTLMGGTWCPPDTWCGQTLDVMEVAFLDSAAVPAYGDVADVYGRVISGGLAPDGFIVVGRCDPDAGC